MGAGGPVLPPLFGFLFCMANFKVIQKREADTGTVFGQEILVFHCLHIPYSLSFFSQNNIQYLLFSSLKLYNAAVPHKLQTSALDMGQN